MGTIKQSATFRSRAQLEALKRNLNLFSEWTGRTISWLTFVMVAITFLVVVLRYLFNVGYIWMQESVTYMHAIVFMIGAAYTFKHDGHVRVDIIYRAVSQKARAWIDLLGTIFLLWPVCGFIFFISWQYVASSWSVLETSPEAGGIPAVFLLKSIIPLMAGLMMLQGLAHAAECLLVITGRAEKLDEDHEVTTLGRTDLPQPHSDSERP
jgi:TRAP-type mannitol/chloroaromatic compound transport system permease small subunit